ncbi:hypothetical protein [Microbacterium sp. T2.11-28]|uniref:hypothetical protein n=1 Tax=Microbacterium sp. T2.11-28 TaxID=3041169 RepID=UPI002477712E|nr:hypothetical protein [Microbacterium sp. T2.11-28]CAI9394175.1 hypothetical protein MICABA_02699 [Microbacterium sp. T2.11-28]
MLSFWQRTTEGVRVLARTGSLRFLRLIDIVVATGSALILVNSVVYIKSFLALDDGALAIAYAAYGVGSSIVAFDTAQIVDAVGVTRTMLGGAVLVLVGLASGLVFTIVAAIATTLWWLLLAV